MTVTELLVPTERGEGRLVLHPCTSNEEVTAWLLLSHGAGGGIEAADLQALAAHLPAQGIAVALFEQPWRRAGRKIAGAPPTLDEAFLAAGTTLRQHLATLKQHELPLVVGGRSAGARSACRTAAQLEASAVVALAFPLHPPGKPERSRAGELASVEVPTLVVQGERDTFGRPEEFPADSEVALVPGGDHSFVVLKRAEITQDEALAVVVESVLEWVLREGAVPHSGAGE